MNHHDNQVKILESYFTENQPPKPLSPKNVNGSNLKIYKTAPGKQSYFVHEILLTRLLSC